MNAMAKRYNHANKDAEATQRQIDFINRLKVERDVPTEMLEDNRRLWREGKFDAAAASKFIDALITLPTVSNLSRKNDHLMGVHNVDGRIIKVQRSRETGRLYTKELRQELSGKWSFAIMPAGLKLVSGDTKISLDEAKKFGTRTGTCCICGRLLTDENSVAAGIGPICASRL
jgi:hypothetical protein